jgi:hypothetical protein
MKVEEIMDMNQAELTGWNAYFQIKSEKQK